MRIIFILKFSGCGQEYKAARNVFSLQTPIRIGLLQYVSQKRQCFRHFNSLCVLFKCI
jgi:hypothetical protein